MRPPAHEDFNELLTFLTVATERSFTRAGAKLGRSQSTISHTIRRLESRLGLRLLTRTTRSVAPTEAGERLFKAMAPRIAEIEAEIAALTELLERPSGTVRITAGDYSYNEVLWPRLAKVLDDYPDIRLEIATDASFRNIVEERFDAGVKAWRECREGHDRRAHRAGLAPGRGGFTSLLLHADPPATPARPCRS